ncbi:SPOR domain-containing protein [Thermocrinis minervae]|uniref:Sporulation related domain-containing protein n=1 Tax=Thermocrinis minervae TaxID=381751 RepID=A0A1M6SRN2_9AQUI|nr:SPOR domain-containing protein [Thermocrinis minervae]SHK47297.1 Sporulation related domain-containing protein [Thermocrinis minervae]
MEKKKRLILLGGLLISLVSFYLGFNSWLKSKEEAAVPPPVVTPVKPPQATVVSQTGQKQPQTQEPQKTEQKPTEQKPVVKEEKTTTEQKTQQGKIEEKPEETKKEKVAAEQKPQQKEEKVSTSRAVKAQKLPKKLYTVQIGAFVNKENAQKLLKKAEGLGYRAFMVEEDNFYKVRIKVASSNINEDLQKIKKTFGSAILK